jgi:hypothetical protein
MKVVMRPYSESKELQVEFRNFLLERPHSFFTTLHFGAHLPLVVGITKVNKFLLILDQQLQGVRDKKELRIDERIFAFIFFEQIPFNLHAHLLVEPSTVIKQSKPKLRHFGTWTN